MPQKSIIAIAMAVLPLCLSTPSWGRDDQSVVLCMDGDGADGTGYTITQKSGYDLFDVEAASSAAGIVAIALVTGVSSLTETDFTDNILIEQEWEGAGSRVGSIARVRVPDDKNKVYQLDLTSMNGTVILGYRPIAKLDCLVSD